MSFPLLFQVAQSPPPVTGYGNLAVMVILVLSLTGGLLLCLVLLIKRIKRRRAKLRAGSAPNREDRSTE